MARQASELNRKVLQNLRTSGSNEYIQEVLSGVSAMGEIIVQTTEPASGTSLWTLAKDGETAVQFINKEEVVEIVEDAVEYINEQIDVLQSAVTELSATTIELEDGLEEEIERATSAETILDMRIDELEKAAVKNDDGSIIVTRSSGDGTDIRVQIKDGEGVIKLDANGNGIYTDIDLIKISSGLSTNVKEAYRLLDSDGNQIGVDVEIYKDSALEKVYLGHVDDELESSGSTEVISGSGNTALCFIYQLSDGTYELVAIDIEHFLEEEEFKDGLEVTEDHEVKIKIDKDSDPYLTVSLDGLKLEGVQEALEELSAITEELRYDLDALAQATAAEFERIQEEIDLLNSGSSLALEEEIRRAKTAESELDKVIGSEKNPRNEKRTYEHYTTNYLDDNTNVKEDVETLDMLLGRYESIPSDSADTVFSSGNTVAMNITEMKKRIAELEAKSIEGEDTDYAETTVEEISGVTTIKVDIITHDIETSSGDTDGLATAFDVKQYAVHDVKDDSTYEKINLKVEEDIDGIRKIDFTNIVIDCGEF